MMLDEISSSDSLARSPIESRRWPAPTTPDRKRKLREAATLLKQVSDATRLRILLMLGEGERNVGALVEVLGNQSQPAVSHHLALLRHGRLIEPRRQGKNNFYALTQQGEALTKTIATITGR